MHVRILLQITADDGTASLTEEVTAFEKSAERPEDLGLSLAEGKAVTAAIQRQVVNAQVASWTERHRGCEACGVRRRSKGSSPVVFRTLYGDVTLASPRLIAACARTRTVRRPLLPLRTLIPDHVPRSGFIWKHAGHRSCPTLPQPGCSPTSCRSRPARTHHVREHALRVAERAESELGDERPCFIDGCPADWAELPIPEGRIVAALDGGYVRNWDDRTSNFELIVGRSVPEDRAPATSAWYMATIRNPNAGCSRC